MKITSQAVYGKSGSLCKEEAVYGKSDSLWKVRKFMENQAVCGSTNSLWKEEAVYGNLNQLCLKLVNTLIIVILVFTCVRVSYWCMKSLVLYIGEREYSF